MATRACDACHPDTSVAGPRQPRLGGGLRMPCLTRLAAVPSPRHTVSVFAWRGGKARGGMAPRDGFSMRVGAAHCVSPAKRWVSSAGGVTRLIRILHVALPPRPLPCTRCRPARSVGAHSATQAAEACSRVAKICTYLRPLPPAAFSLAAEAHAAVLPRSARTASRNDMRARPWLWHSLMRTSLARHSACPPACVLAR